MTYENFMEEVKKHVLEYLPEEYAESEVRIDEVEKNINQKTRALFIRREEETVLPSVYLKEFYEMYSKGKNMDDVLSAIAHTYLESQKKKEELFPFNIKDYDSMKDKLYIKLMNKNQNKENLEVYITKDIPETDLTAVVSAVLSKNAQDGTVAFPIRQALQGIWGITREQLYEQALQNTPRLFPAELINMRDVMRSIYGIGMSEEEGDSIEKYLNEGRQEGYKEIESRKVLLPFEQYVLTNTAKFHGISAILYPGLLQEIGEATKSNFFILPSSIHEAILIKDNGDMSAEELQHMVIEVNRTQLKADEVLSDEVYCYNYQEKRLAMATDPKQTEELLKQLGEIWESANNMEVRQESDMEMER